MSDTPRTDAERSKCCYAIFTGQGGYPMENERANATFEVGKQYIITGGSIGQSSTSLKIEGFGGGWNSVMFDFDWESAPLVFSYLTSRYNVGGMAAGADGPPMPRERNA
jgi:hypothetical protein